MVEKILEEFKKKKAEILEQPKFKEQGMNPEKEKEILKETVLSHVQTAQPVPDDQQQVIAQSAQQMSKEPKERQIKLLTDLVFEKGISRAIEVAKRLENPYLLDEFHDTLVDELYNKLIEEDKLDKV